MPAPAIAAAVLRGATAAREAQAALAAERELAKRTAGRAAASALQGKAESVERLAKKLKQLKRIGWLIKGVTLGTTSLGDVFISVWVLLFWSNMELFIFPLILPWWNQSGWEKAITYMLDFFVLMVIVVVFGIMYALVSDPAMACENLGPAVSPILGLFGKVGGCELAGTVYKWVAQ